MRDDTDPPLTPTLLLQGYRAGVFPMSESRDDPTVFWVDPRKRGVLQLDHFHVSRSLARTLRRDQFTATTDEAFNKVVDHCADRNETWINETIHDLYQQLHYMGVAHSVEVWDGDELAGGVYGVCLGAAFFGESMFSRRTNGSKVALFCAVEHLREKGFQLFDTQFLTDHLASLGAVEVSRSTYHSRLERALSLKADFGPAVALPPTSQLLQRKTQTS